MENKNLQAVYEKMKIVVGVEIGENEISDYLQEHGRAFCVMGSAQLFPSERAVRAAYTGDSARTANKIPITDIIRSSDGRYTLEIYLSESDVAKSAWERAPEGVVIAHANLTNDYLNMTRQGCPDPELMDLCKKPNGDK